MRSKVHIKGHPLHPILVSFPIAFLTGTLLFDAIGFFMNDPRFWLAGYYLEIAGIGFGLIAAIPGFADYLFRVPPASSAKKRAAKHGILNLLLLMLFTAAWIYRHESARAPLIVLGAEVLGVLIMSFSGWLGGTLVHRNQIGVDHRYAYAGKWKEKRFGESPGETEVGGMDELRVNQMMLVHINGKRVVIGRTENGFVAFDDHCTHRGGTLADGSMTCGIVQCPWHGSQFDCRTGEVKAGPAHSAIRTYALRIDGDRLLLKC
jgi:uncharacterized membrane protein/nitrite reductase/ring-hydroxylating ferredoxin subunit